MEILNKVTGRTDQLGQMLPLPGAVKQKHGRKIGLIAGLVLAIVVIAGGFLIYNVVKPHDDLATTQKAIASATQTGIKDDKVVIRKLLSARGNAATKEGKREADYILASRYSDAKNHARAYKYYVEAISLSEKTDINSILGAAGEADLLGNKTAANTYYQKAIDYYTPLAKNNPSYQTVINVLKARLK